MTEIAGWVSPKYAGCLFKYIVLLGITLCFHIGKKKWVGVSLIF